MKRILILLSLWLPLSVALAQSGVWQKLRGVALEAMMEMRGSEPMADPGLVGERAAAVARHAERQYRAEQLGDHAPSVALVAAEGLARASERHDAAAGLPDDV